MRVYFFQLPVATTELSENYRTIVSAMRDAGAFVVSSSNENNIDFKKEELEMMQEAGEILLDKMDCFVIEASKPDQEIGYLLAYAISQKKPLLYLYKKGTPDTVAHGYLTKKNTPDFIRMAAYTQHDLEQIVTEFVEEVGSGKGLKQKPTIKFTLRITPAMEQWLKIKSKKSKKTKADYLREEIEKLMGEE